MTYCVERDVKLLTHALTVSATFKQQLSLSGRVYGSLSDFVTRVSLICVSAFLSLFKYLATIYGEIKMCELKMYLFCHPGLAF